MAPTIFDDVNVPPSGTPQEPVYPPRTVLDDVNVLPAGGLPPPTTAPSIPQSLMVEGRSGGARLTWTDPVASERVTGYRATFFTGAQMLTYDLAVDPGVEVAGLTNDTEYLVRLYAINEVGTSIPAEATFTPSPSEPTPGSDAHQPTETVPSPPVLVSVVQGPGSLLASWEPAAVSGESPVTSYVITATPTGQDHTGVSQVTVGDVDSAVISELVDGVQYSVVVQAVNAVGISVASNALLATPDPAGQQLVAEPVTDLAADPLNGGTALSWVPGDLGMGEFEAYVITATSGFDLLTYPLQPQVTSLEIDGLTNDVEWVVTVLTRTSLGDSAPSVVTVTPTGASPAPTTPVRPVTAGEPEPGGPGEPVPPAPAPPIVLITYAFPPNRILAPRNFGRLLSEVPEEG